MWLWVMFAFVDEIVKMDGVGFCGVNEFGVRCDGVGHDRLVDVII